MPAWQWSQQEVKGENGNSVPLGVLVTPVGACDPGSVRSVLLLPIIAMTSLAPLGVCPAVADHTWKKYSAALSREGMSQMMLRRRRSEMLSISCFTRPNGSMAASTSTAGVCRGAADRSAGR